LDRFYRSHHPPSPPLAPNLPFSPTPAAIVSKKFDLKLPDRTFSTGVLSFEGLLRAVGGLRSKLKWAARHAIDQGWDEVSVVIPMANVMEPGGWVIDADGSKVGVEDKALRECCASSP
jgi:hypothetical protein